MEGVCVVDVDVFVGEEGLEDLDFVGLGGGWAVVRLVDAGETVEEGGAVVFVQAVHADVVIEEQPTEVGGGV